MKLTPFQKRAALGLTVMMLIAAAAIPVGPEYDTLTDLLSHQPIPNVNAKWYSLKGRVTIGDGFQGEFMWVNGSITTTNAGTVFAWGNGRLIRIYIGAVNLQWFGADPSATMNSRNALQGAFNTAGASGSVYVPPGKYKITYGLPIQGFISRFYGEGQFYGSMPSDYVNPNVYGVPNKYVATGLLDRTGATVSWDSSTSANPDSGYYGIFPWNGKTAMFQDIGSSTKCVIEGLSFDGGWGTTGAPGSVIPITGVRRTGDEATWYATFANCSNLEITHCKFSNIPGDPIVDPFGKTAITECVFGDFGDHVIYIQDQDGIQFNNNKIIFSRETVGTEGNLNYVSQTYRDAIKLRNARNVTVNDNVMQDNTLSPLSQFLNLESFSHLGSTSLTNGMRNITVNGNTIKTKVGILAGNNRFAGDGVGNPTKDVTIGLNTWDVSERLLQALDFACDGFILKGNTVNMHGGQVAQIYGSMVFDKAVKRLIFDNNYFTGTETNFGRILIGGNVDSVIIKNNICIQTNVEHGFVMTLVDTFSQASPTKNFTRSILNSVELTGNKMINYEAMLFDAGMQLWDSAVTYTYATETYDDGTYVINQFVREGIGGASYTNKATILSATAPSLDPANWGVYQPPDCNVTMLRNERYSDSTQVAFTGARLLAIVNNTTLKYNYKVTHNDNVHKTTLNQEIAYVFQTGLDASQVVYVYTNLYSSVNKLLVRYRGGFGGEENPKASLHVFRGGLRSDGNITTDGVSDTAVFAISPGSISDNSANRDIRFEQVWGAGDANQYLIYNGFISNKTDAIHFPEYWQGLNGRMSFVQFEAGGNIDFWINNGPASSGTNLLVNPTRLFRLRPGVMPLDPTRIEGTGNLSLSGDATITGTLTVPTLAITTLNASIINTTNGINFLMTNSVPSNTNAAKWVKIQIDGVNYALPASLVP